MLYWTELKTIYFFFIKHFFLAINSVLTVIFFVILLKTDFWLSLQLLAFWLLVQLIGNNLSFLSFLDKDSSWGSSLPWYIHRYLFLLIVNLFYLCFRIFVNLDSIDVFQQYWKILGLYLSNIYSTILSFLSFWNFKSIYVKSILHVSY